jgi:Ran GTPase-activating protein (RanGAP) involved in mRNA processing and transport
MFTQKSKDKLPPALKLLLEAILARPIRNLTLSDNAFGPNGAPSIAPLLQKTTTLRFLNVNNCGLGPTGSGMLVDALLTN